MFAHKIMLLINMSTIKWLNDVDKINKEIVFVKKQENISELKKMWHSLAKSLR